jgi:MFS family permease
MLQLPEFQALQQLTRDGRILFGTRIVRLFAYGFLSVVLVLYLKAIGYNDQQVGTLLTLTLVGDFAIQILITNIADRSGRRRMLIVGSGLMVFAGFAFAATTDLTLLTLAAIIGTISPSGNEVGPFLAIEQATLPQTTTDKLRTQVFAWYGLIGSLATAFGALCGGVLSGALQAANVTPVNSYRVVVVGYGILGIALGVLFTRLSDKVEIKQVSLNGAPKGLIGLHRSRGIVLKLSLLFMIDAFAGGMVVNSFVADWFHVKYGVDPAALGVIFFGTNVLAGFSALAAARVAARIGLLNTMVWTHVPSNLLLILVPLMPNLPLAILCLLGRYSISQMDVPTRQSYTVAVVDPDERSAAAGVTQQARTIASAISPSFTGMLFNGGLLSVPFFVAGGLKLVYDISLLRAFQTVKPPEEQTRPT